MGFRCPNCRKDFGLDKSLLDEHLQNAIECSGDAQYLLMKTEFLANKDVPKKQRKIEYTSERMYKTLDIRTNNIKRQYEFIGNHQWAKINVVSNEDCSDDIKCKVCGLKAKRYLDSIVFNKKTSANAIENCKGKKNI